MINVDQIIETAPRLSAEDRQKVLRSLGWLTLAELSELTNYSKSSLHNFIREGMPHFRGAGKYSEYRFDQTALDWMRENGRNA